MTTDSPPTDLPDGLEESDTKRDGVLSYAWEWHALAHGLYLGLVTKPWDHPPEPQREDVQKESHYYRGGYVIATAVQWGVMLLVAALAAWVSPALGGPAPIFRIGAP